MSLIDENMTECAFMEKSKVSDGEGGTITTWTEGNHFMGAIVMQASSLASIADAIKETRSYTIIVKKDVSLEYGNAIKRLSDGATFRIMSETADQKTPNSSSLDIALAKAERWELTI